jgi:hypothetical protein
MQAQQKSPDQIKSFWANQAADLHLAPSSTAAIEPMAIQLLSSWQESNGPEFWSTPSLVSDCVNEILISYPGQVQYSK